MDFPFCFRAFIQRMEKLNIRLTKVGIVQERLPCSIDQNKSSYSGEDVTSFETILPCISSRRVVGFMVKRGEVRKPLIATDIETVA